MQQFHYFFICFIGLRMRLFKFLIFWMAGCLLAGLSSISEELQCQLGREVSFQKRQGGKPEISASGKKPLIE